MKHHTNLENSERLQAALEALRDGQWHDGFTLAQAARTLAIGSTISDLRDNGYEIDHRYNGKTGGARVKSEYRLVKTVEIKEQTTFLMAGLHGKAVVK